MKNTNEASQKLNMEQTTTDKKAILAASTKLITQEIKRGTHSFFVIGFELIKLQGSSAFEGTPYKDVYQYAKDNFGISRCTVSDWINTAAAFAKHDENGNLLPEMEDRYIDFLPTQLQLIRKLPENLRTTVSSDMTASQVRKMLKDSKEQEQPKSVKKQLEKAKQPEIVDGESIDLHTLAELKADDLKDFKDASSTNQKKLINEFVQAHMDVLISQLLKGNTIEIVAK